MTRPSSHPSYRLATQPPPKESTLPARWGHYSDHPRAILGAACLLSTARLLGTDAPPDVVAAWAEHASAPVTVSDAELGLTLDVRRSR